jgi:hypothetical protein
MKSPIHAQSKLQFAAVLFGIFFALVIAAHAGDPRTTTCRSQNPSPALLTISRSSPF